MEDFISKEFECRNRFTSDNKVINSIVDFLRTIDDKIEIENKNGKIVNAKSFIKMMGLDIKYGYRFVLYIYGDDKENNLKRIEELLEKKDFYTLEKIEEIEKEEIEESSKLLEDEILSLTPNDKKEIIKNDIENKTKLLKEKRDTIHLKTLNFDNNILYIKKEDDKNAIIDIINNNIKDVIKQLSSDYEIEIKEDDLYNFLYLLVEKVKEKSIEYFYIYLFFNNVKKYFYNQFDTLFIKKLIGLEVLYIEYDIEINDLFIEEAIKNIDFILEDKKKSSDYSINIYMLGNTLNINMDMYRIINIVQNTGKIYEIKDTIMDSIIDRIKESYEDKNKTENAFHDAEYLDTIREFKDYFQKVFEGIYLSKVLEKYNEHQSIDYHYISRLVRRL